MSDTLVQNYVNGKPLNSAATEFTELVASVAGKVAGRALKSTPGASRMSRDLTSAVPGSTQTIPLAAEMWHGGFGHSGYGEHQSGYGLADYIRVKLVMSSLEW